MNSKPKTILWIAGWAVPTEFVLSHVSAQFPECRHLCIPANEDCMQQISRIAADVCIGYSLGALLLLKSSWQLRNKPGILIAGFSDLRNESKRGGRFPVAEIKTIQRNLGRHPLRTLNHFYRHFGLSLTCQSIDDYDLDELNWGLDFLANESYDAVIPDNFYAYLGGRDRLIDAVRAAEQLPHSKTIPSAGHCLCDYLPHIKL